MAAHKKTPAGALGEKRKRGNSVFYGDRRYEIIKKKKERKKKKEKFMCNLVTTSKDRGPVKNRGGERGSLLYRLEKKTGYQRTSIPYLGGGGGKESGKQWVLSLSQRLTTLIVGEKRREGKKGNLLQVKAFLSHRLGKRERKGGISGGRVHCSPTYFPKGLEDDPKEGWGCPASSLTR